MHTLNLYVELGEVCTVYIKLEYCDYMKLYISYNEYISRVFIYYSDIILVQWVYQYIVFTTMNIPMYHTVSVSIHHILHLYIVLIQWV